MPVRLRPLRIYVRDPLDRDIEVAHGAKCAVEPLQFAPYAWFDGIIDHRREQPDGGAQMRQRNPHVMQGVRVAFAGRFLA